jgi:multidrug efflux pump subunit AcrA (membrane-fusion protein)
VASVGLTAGSSARSSTITITATGSAKVTVNVPLTQIRLVKVGQAAHVTADGSTTAVSGTVQSIGLLATTSNTGTTSYPVVILVSQAPAALATGSRARASIVLATRTNVVTVPNSALTRAGTGSASVTVLAAGATSRKAVQIGAVGLLATEITGGLTVGEQLVIADRKQALPSNSTTTGRIPGGTTTFGGGQGGFGGGQGGGFVRPGG